MGNPINYRNNMVFTWDSANNLTSMSVGSTVRTYTYNDNGIRTSKTVGGVTHYYYLEGSRIVAEVYNDTLILYAYDETGSIISMAYRDSTYASNTFDRYLFTKNLQGDVIGIYDVNGNKVATYNYNAWGECTLINATGSIIGTKNPFRYRGYYCDTEIGFYYLNSRYYDPKVKRFISPDSYINANGDFTGFNMYAYCSDNPVIYVDYQGTWTVEIGVNTSAYFIGGGSMGYSIIIDSYGNLAIIRKSSNVANNNGGTFGLFGFGISLDFGLSLENNSVEELDGYSTGVSFDMVGIESDMNMTKVTGISISPISQGVSSKVNVYVIKTETKAIYNIKKVVRRIEEKISDLKKTISKIKCYL